tara:strand:- start:3979 stop:5001 length:1023 start_codon:yes stop_codon:yes gene_type:complete
MNLLKLKTVLAKEFPDLGNFIDINPMRFDFNVNNSLYLYKTDLGKYIVKEMYLARDFYGIPNPKDRLELISKVSSHLKNSGINLESIKSSASGKFLVTFENNFLRVFDFFESEGLNPAEPEQFRQMILLSKKLHELPLEEFISYFPNLISLLVAPYGLDKTLEQFDCLKENLLKETDSFSLIKSNLSLVFEKGLSLSQWNLNVQPVLTHMDFHPRNVLWGKDNSALMIDMDYLRVGNPFVCLGLTLTRTLLYLKKEISTQNIHETITEMYETYCPRIDIREFNTNLIKGSIFCEVEKILRNLYRYYKTGEYRKFADDVATLHLPLFLELLKIESEFLKVN